MEIECYCVKTLFLAITDLVLPFYKCIGCNTSECIIMLQAHKVLLHGMQIFATIQESGYCCREGGGFGFKDCFLLQLILVY